MKTVLITGAAGRIGSSLRQHLAKQYHFRCLDIQPVIDADDVIVADVMDFDAVLAAMQGIDAVIHLAANPLVSQSWNDVYTSGIGGTYNVFDAARQAGVKKIIYASTNHVSAGWETELKGLIKPEMPVRPDSLYAVGKAVGEALGRFYSDNYGMSIICLRIGWFEARSQPKNVDKRLLKIWCSPRDLAQLVSQSLDTDNLGFQIFYGISKNRRRVFDISNAKKTLGYKPQDDAEPFLFSDILW